ncbi:MAG: glycosyltransferase family 4 protein [Paracoccaceae bacterium]
MRVAVVLPRRFAFDEARPNSIESVVRTLNARGATGDEVVVVADRAAPGAGGFEVAALDPHLTRTGRRRALRAALARIAPDFVEVHQDAITASVLAQAMPTVPFALYRHNFVKPAAGPFKRWLRLRRYRRLAGLIFVSHATREHFAASMPEIAGRCHTVQNAVEAPAWYAPVRPRDPVIAFAGRAAPEKGFGELCAALPLVLDACPDWRVGICALDWGRHRAWAEAQVAPLRRFGPRLDLALDQPIARVRALLGRASIVLVPSVFPEPFGLAALEAHAAGAAVVSSGSGGLREASGEHALFLDAVTPEHLGAAIQRLIECAEERVALADAGQRWVAAHHDARARGLELSATRARVHRAFLERRST